MAARLGCVLLKMAGILSLTGPHYSGTEWVQRVEFSRNLQRHGKAYFTNNEYGDFHNQAKDKEPCARDPLNCIERPIREWVIASYLVR